MTNANQKKQRSNFLNFASVYEYRAGGGVLSKLADGIKDLRGALILAPTWQLLAWRDLVRSTRRTKLGVLWSILSTGISVAILGYVYGRVMGMDPKLAYPFIAGGLVLWFFISACIMGGLSVYNGARGILQETTLPIGFSVFRFITRYCYELGFKSAVFMIAAVAVALPIGTDALMVIPGLAVLLLTGAGVVLLLGPIGARWPDIIEVVSPLMLLAFLASPVLWPSSMLGTNEHLVLLNPFFHFLSIVRDPLMGTPFPYLSLKISIAIMFVVWALAIPCHCLSKDRIVHWL
jgi:ABC-type polysaccharide/polyol phosphate export permease